MNDRSEKRTPSGVMLYFSDWRPLMQRLSTEEIGELVKAVMAFAENGEIPTTTGMVGLAFDLLTPKITRDAENYYNRCIDNQYAVYCREAKKRSEEPLSKDEWKKLISSHDNK